MRGSTAALAVIAVLAIGALFFSWRGGSAERQEARSLAAPAPADRPGQAKSRIDDLRAAYDRRDSLGESGGTLENSAGTLEKKAQELRPERPAMRREVPTRGVMVAQEGTLDDLPFDEDDAEEVDELRNVILDDPDPDERVGAILMLSGNEHPEAVNTFIRAMTDTDPEVRLAAVEALGDYSETLEPNVLEPAIDDPDPEVRFEAVSLLGDMETPAAFEMVRRALDDPDEDVRDLAVGIIEDAGDS